jgi:hypothetical protein
MSNETSKPALLGGMAAVTLRSPAWPLVTEADVEAVAAVVAAAPGAGWARKSVHSATSMPASWGRATACAWRMGR